MTDPRASAPTAVIGAACRLPGASDLGELWRSLIAERDAIVEIPDSRWSAAYHDPEPGVAGRTRSRWCGLLDEVERFDARFFQISAREARSMDPQQRLLLEESWRCIEDAAINPRHLGERSTGVFVGVMAGDYQQRLLEAGVEPDAFAALGNYECILANRVSHCLGLAGPSLSVNAACASSLVALHLARRALAAGDCEYALVGAVNLNLHPWKYVSFSQAGMLSPRGRCRSFDVGADGYVPGDGVAVVLLTSLARAQAGHHRVHALIRGSAINHVGGGRSITAPSVASQRRLIEAAAADAGVGLDTIQYVEAHGTGTSLGDPIEVAALEHAFAAADARPGACTLGSLKSNMGHLEAAAGLAGLLKLVVMLRHRTVPATIHLEHPNPLLELEGSCFRLARTAEAWPRPRSTPRRAGLSSFGFGGANAHVIVEQAPEDDGSAQARGGAGRESDAVELFCMSAHTDEALARNLEAWRRFVSTPVGERASLRDLCGVAAQRPAFARRFAACVRSHAELRDAISAPAIAAFDGLAPSGGPQRWALWFAAVEVEEGLAAWSRLVQLGLTATQIGYEGEGWRPAMVAAGICATLDDNAPLARPRVALLDAVGGRLLRPLRAGPEYLEELREDALVDCERASAALVERGRALWQRQFTFTKYLREWERPLAVVGIDSLSTSLAAASPSPALALAVAVALREVDERWMLARTPRLGGALSELVDLIVDEALSRSSGAKLLEIAASVRGELVAKLECVGPCRPYPRLRRYNLTLDEIGDRQEWFAALERAPSAALPTDHRVVRIGGDPPRRPGEIALTHFDEPAWRAFAAELWRSGAALEIERVYPAGSFTVVDAPTYRFAGPRAWVADSAEVQDRSPSLLELAREHRIGGRLLVPGACSLAAALTDCPGELRGVVLLRPIEVDEPSEVVPPLKVERDGNRVLVTHEQRSVMRARICDVLNPRTQPFAAAWLESDGPPEERASTRIYADFAARGYGYGPRLETLGASRRSARGVEFALSPSARASSAGLIEAGFQALVAEPMLGLLVPFAVDRVWMASDAVAAAERVIVELDGLTTSRWGVRGRAVICAADGRVVLELDGVDLRYLEALGAVEPAEPEPAEPESPRPFGLVDPMLLHRPVWRQAPSDGSGSAPADSWESTATGSTWLVAAPGEVADRLAEQVRDLRRIELAELSGLREAERLFGLGERPRRVLVVLEFVAAPAPAPALAIVNLCRALGRARATEVVQLVLVTCGLHGVEVGERPGPPDCAAMIGAAKSAARELEFVELLAVDLDRRPDAAQLRMLLNERGPAPLLELAYRGERRYALCLEPYAPVSSPPPLREGGVYVIVGGLGGLGRTLARWLAEHYRAKLALIGRRFADDDCEAALAEIARLGGEPVYLRADTRDREQLADALAQVRARFGRIDGAVHSALQLSDRSIRHMDAEHFESVYAVKARGACLLAELCVADGLDFLALFSSVLALQGNAGQANYVAGCAYQDALAPWLRSHRGCRAVSIGWGHWGEVGAVADAHHAGLLSEQGIAPISVADGIAGFAAALASGESRIVVARLSEARRASMVLAPRTDSEVFDCEAGLDALDAYARARVFAFLRSAAPELLGRRASFELRDLTEALNSLPKYEGLLAAWLADLATHGLLEAVADQRWRVLARPSSSLANLRAQVLVEGADKRAHVELLDVCMDGAATMLAGRTPAPAVLFPDSSLRLVEGIYRNNAFSDAYNRLLGDAVVAAVERRPARRVRILELGAGTGGSTAGVLPALDRFAERITYVYSDVSRAFIKHGKRRFAAGRPYLEFALLDIEEIDAATVERLGTFDVVLATNVVHACADLRGTLAGVRRLLANGGELLLNELCRVELFWTSTFGFLDGWWLFSDPQLRLAHGPLVGPDAWPVLLATSGFEATRVWGLARSQSKRLRQCLIAGRQGSSILAACGETRHSPLLGLSAEGGRSPEPTLFTSSTMKAERLRTTLSELTADVLEVDLAEIELDDNFSALGIDSILGVELVAKINAALGTKLEPTVVYDYPTIDALAAKLASELEWSVAVTAEEKPRSSASVPDDLWEPEPRGAAELQVSAELRVPTSGPRPRRPAAEPEAIAIIGVAGRFPGARKLADFWANLVAGVDSVTEVPRSRWDINAVFAADPRQVDTTPCRYGGFLDGVDRFDAGFFKIAPREAERMDPQQRLLLEESWRALEDGGYAGARRERERLGVFIGARQGDYLLELRRRGLALDGPTFMGTDAAMLAGRIAYHLDATGPALTIDTACSSSLVAIHQGCQHLRSGEAELALAGGVFVMNTPQFHILAGKTGMLAAGGRCRTFDDGAEGFVPAEGVGVVLLKPAAAAIADGDYIYGLIRASGVNQDGRTNGITAPSGRSQTRLIREVYERGGIDARTISYVEAHGTGTKLGDPIEVEGLRAAFEAGGAIGPGSCVLGSVKANIGHAATAAGVASVLKVLLAMRARELPPSIHFEVENRHLGLARTPFRVITRREPWTTQPRRAALSSFGFSGTNCHMVIEQGPELEARRPVGSRAELFVLASSSEAALRQRIVELREWLREREQAGALAALDLADIAYSLAVRHHEGHRVALVAANLQELITKLDSVDPRVLGSAEPAASALLRRFVAGLVDELGGHHDDHGRREGLEALADAYLAGHPVDWLRIYRPGACRIVPLPTYPFAAERHWPEFGVSSSDAAVKRPATRMLVRRWVAAHERCDAERTLTGVIVLVGPDDKGLGERLSEAIEDRYGGLVRARVIAIRALSNSAMIAKLLAAGAVEVLVDLTDLGGGGPSRERIALLQAVVEDRRQRGLTVLHVSDRQVALGAGPFNADATLVAAVVARLRAEHRTILGRSLDVDIDDLGLDAAKVILAELAELHAGGVPTQVAIRGGRRHEPILELQTPPPVLPLRPSEHGVYVISGGVRGLGLEVARWLVDRGARKLVLLGRRALPNAEQWTDLLADPRTPGAVRERLAPLEALREAGAVVKVHTGDLAEFDAVERVLEQVRSELGPIVGFIHCAGAVALESPAFVNKSATDLDAVIGPKLAGLEIADGLLRSDALEFVIVFSSVSAVVPRLAAGLLDYASANAVLAAWAERRRAEGKPCWALAWGNWTGAGFGPVAGRAYTELGLAIHDVATGLDLLERALMLPAGLVMPVAVEPDRFDERALAALPSPRIITDPGLTVSSGEAPGGATELGLRRQLVAVLRSTLARALKLPESRIVDDLEFGEQGIDSILIVEFIVELESWLGCKLDPTLALDHPTILALAEQLERTHQTVLRDALAPPKGVSMPTREPASGRSEAPVITVVERSRTPTYAPIAVIGMAGKLPQAPDLAAYWRQLRAGRDCTREIPSGRWSIAEHYAVDHQPGKSISKRGGFVEGIELFDPEYFEIPVADAAELDPLVRQFLEVGAGCLHHAGYARAELAGRSVGVFVGARTSNYAERLVTPGRRSLLGIGQNFIAAHLAHFYDLRGPVMVVDTACSSSLTSVHQAAASLQAGECELALAGGVEILLDELVYQRLTAARVLSPDGRCRVFDEGAAGFVPGEGAGAVLLTTLERARAHGDHIYAVIEGTAINNDGKTMGVTTPNPAAQQRVVREALRRAGLDARAIGYVEAHGTGTALGDPVELRALTELFEADGVGPGRCLVGSVKSNLGHLLSAAGIASLLKVVLALGHRQLPPTIHCERPNSRFDFEASPFRPCTQLRPWREQLRAGISSFGFGGTNVHAIVAAAPDHAARRRPLPAPEFNHQRFWLARPDRRGSAISSETGFGERPLGPLRFDPHAGREDR